MSVVIVPQEKDQILPKLAHSQFSVFTHMRVCMDMYDMILLVRLLPVIERKIKDSSNGVGREREREQRWCQRCAAVQFLFVFVESVFLVESVETEHVEGSDKLPVG